MEKTAQAQYDPRVASRILRVKDMNAADYIDVLVARDRLIAGGTMAIAAPSGTLPDRKLL